MEQLKEPGVVLSMANSVGLLGVAGYFYKQIEALNESMAKVATGLKLVTRKLAEIEKGDQHKGEALRVIGDQIKRINEAIEDVPTMEAVEIIGADLSGIIDTLEENNILVEQAPPPRSTRRQVKGRGRSSYEIEERPSARRRPIKQERTREVKRLEPRSDHRSEKYAEEDSEDVDEIIDVIRKQQGDF